MSWGEGDHGTGKGVRIGLVENTQFKGGPVIGKQKNRDVLRPRRKHLLAYNAFALPAKVEVLLYEDRK